MVITSPEDQSAFVEGGEIVFTATASDSEDGNISSDIIWASQSSGNFGTGRSVNVSSLSVGVHTITATVTDSGGILGSAEIQITIEAANTPPEVQITAPSDNTSVDEGVEITFTGTATDDEDGTLT